MANTHPGSYSGQDVYTGHLLPVLMDQGGESVEDNMTGTLRSQSKGHEPVIMINMGGDKGGASNTSDGTSFTLSTNEPHAIAFTLSPGAREMKDDIHVSITDQAKTLDASGSSVEMHQGGTGVIHFMQVRRLTPTECERLQGFPDDWTLVPWRGKDAPDGPRYKALGNSMAVPVMRWIGERIQGVQDAALAATSPQPSLD